MRPAPAPQVVSGPTCGDPYLGPCIDELDRVVAMATELGLEVLLDLHGNPGVLSARFETANPKRCCTVRRKRRGSLFTANEASRSPQPSLPALAPQGETDNKCCGSDHPEWSFEEWRRPEALQVLGTVARRYAHAAAVTAVQVGHASGVAHGRGV